MSIKVGINGFAESVATLFARLWEILMSKSLLLMT